MQIECLADNYKYIKDNKKITVYNSLYESNTLVLFISAFLGIFAPDINDLNIPLAIEIDNNNTEIKIDKNLSVSGTDEFYYFIPKDHYSKWKKTFKLAYRIILILELMVSMLFVYIFLISSKHKLLTGLAFAVVFGMALLLVNKNKKQEKLIKKYEIKEKNFW